MLSQWLQFSSRGTHESLSQVHFLFFFFLFSPKEWQRHTEAQNKMAPNNMMTTKEKKKKSIFKQLTKRKKKHKKNKKYEHLTAYLSISTARELSLILIFVAGWGWKGLAYSHCFSFVHVGLALLSPVSFFSCLTSRLILFRLCWTSTPLLSCSEYFFLLSCSCCSSHLISYKHILLY